MAKNKGKKSKRKGKKIGQPNAKIKNVKVPKVSPQKTTVPAPLTDPVVPTSSEPESNNNGAAARCTEKESEKAKRISGYIFMCNPSTKLECYQYRVFGLPLGKKEVVEEIKPGTKLFLFDFQLKHLYGIYEATSAGNLNLEPAAFGGRFPAQVKFKIFKECLPLPENSLRHIINENYTGLKFRQELSRKQVNNLSSSFRPLTASSYQPVPRALANVSLPWAMPASAMGHQFMHTGGPPAMEVPYLAQMHYSRIPSFVEPQHVSKVNVLPHGYHGATAYAEHVNPTLDLQSLTPASSYYVANSHQSAFTEGVARGVQEPSYARYLTVEERASHDQVNNLETRYERAPHDQVMINLERQKYHHQLPLQREEAVVVYQQDNVAAAYNPSAPALYNNNTTSSQVVHAPPPYYPSPLQRGSQYHQDSSVVVYNSNPAAAAAQYTAAAYRDNAAVASTIQPPQAGVGGISSQPNIAPISNYYSYN